MSLPVTCNLSVYRGDTWEQAFRLLNGTVPLDLTDATVKSEARNGSDHVTSLPVDVEDAVDGQLVLSLPEGSLPPGRYVYDLEVDDGGIVTTWVRGSLSVIRDVTDELPL